jgi:uncharacterized protein YndB with AHSA1/START domain
MQRFGTVEIKDDSATLVFRRQLPHPPEDVWRALTSPEELAQWYMAEAKIDGREGGSIDMIAGPARFHWTGKILTWKPFSVLEYEFHTPVHEHLPNGERSIVRYELREIQNGTEITLTHSYLSKRTALGFAPGTHALLDRLEARLGQEFLPDFFSTYDEVKSGYPSWSSQT